MTYVCVCASHRERGGNVLVFIFQRVPLALNTSEQKQTFMDLDVSMRIGACPFTVKFYGAMIEEVILCQPYVPLAYHACIYPLTYCWFKGEVWICMELMDSSVETLYQTAFKHQRKISEEFLKKLAFSVIFLFSPYLYLPLLASTSLSLPLPPSPCLYLPLLASTSLSLYLYPSLQLRLSL